MSCWKSEPTGAAAAAASSSSSSRSTSSLPSSIPWSIPSGPSLVPARRPVTTTETLRPRSQTTRPKHIVETSSMPLGANGLWVLERPPSYDMSCQCERRNHEFRDGRGGMIQEVSFIRSVANSTAMSKALLILRRSIHIGVVANNDDDEGRFRGGGGSAFATI